MRTPLQKFARQENVSTRFLYKEARCGRLVLTKVGGRTFVDDEDAEAWRKAAPKYDGTGAEAVMKQAVQKLQDVGRAVAAGKIDKAFAMEKLDAAAHQCGLAA
jgi:hypothetical protein